MTASKLSVRNLSKTFDTGTGILDFVPGLTANRKKPPIRAVDDVSFDLDENETIGIIGESGCGKSTLLLTLMGLYDPVDGDIRYEGESIADFSKSEWKEYRRKVQIIFQDPASAMDPKFTVEQTLHEPLKIHGVGNRAEKVEAILEQVELNPPSEFLDRKPAQLSGGEKQRVAIARALVLEPDVVLADEPVSMLDVSTQAAILNLLSKLTTETDIGLLYISHDLSTVSYICDEINVMYLGRFVERGRTMDVLQDPKHPYASALVDAVPVPDPDYERDRARIPSSVSVTDATYEGCRFRDRCPERMDVCETVPRFSTPVDAPDRTVACHLYDDATDSDEAARVRDAGDLR